MIFIVPLIAVVVLLLAAWAWGGVRDAMVHDADEARAILAVEHPEWRPSLITSSVDGRGALACAPPDESVAVVFAHGDTLTSRLLHAGDLARIEESVSDQTTRVTPDMFDAQASHGTSVDRTAPDAPSVRARLHLHDLGCPQLELRLPASEWATWRPRLQRLVAASVLLLSALSATAGAQGSSACDASMRATFTPARPRPGTLVLVQLAGYTADGSPRAAVAGEPLHFRADSAGGWRALAAVPIDAGASLGLRVACPATGDSTTLTVALASASYPLEKLRVAPQFSAKPDSALAARLEREAARAAAISRASHDTPRLWSTPFRAPRDSRVTSTFGRGREFNGTVTSRHMGTDYAGAVGAPIRAANRGVVRLVDRFYLGGNVVYIDHGEGLVTAYLHLSQHRVAEGDTVAQGAVIGLVGATGRVTGPHLHWIARYGRISVDPASLLRATGAAAASGAPAAR